MAPLLLLAFLLCFSFASEVWSTVCSLPNEKNATSCTSKIASGVNCDGESEVRQCYKKCEDTATAYKELNIQMKVFEDAVCRNGLENKIKENVECVKEIFLQCKDVYKHELKEANICKENKVTYDSCSKSILLRYPSVDCEDLLKHIIPAMVEACINGKRALAGASMLVLILVKISFSNSLLLF